MNIFEIQIVKTNSPNVQARADLVFEDHTIKGFKIIKDPTTGKDYVTPPSYSTPTGWRPLFKTSTKEQWSDLCSVILKRFNEYQIDVSMSEHM